MITVSAIPGIAASVEWVTIPKTSPDPSKLRLTLMGVPSLVADSSPTTLSDPSIVQAYPDLINWPSWLNFLFRGGAISFLLGIDGTDTSITTTGALDSQAQTIWDAVFPPSTLVGLARPVTTMRAHLADNVDLTNASRPIKAIRDQQTRLFAEFLQLRFANAEDPNDLEGVDAFVTHLRAWGQNAVGTPKTETAPVNGPTYNQLVAGLRRYPQLYRWLGFCFDLEFDLGPSKTAAPLTTVRVRLNPPQNVQILKDHSFAWYDVTTHGLATVDETVVRSFVDTIDPIVEGAKASRLAKPGADPTRQQLRRNSNGLALFVDRSQSPLGSLVERYLRNVGNRQAVDADPTTYSNCVVGSAPYIQRVAQIKADGTLGAPQTAPRCIVERAWSIQFPGEATRRTVQDFGWTTPTKTAAPDWSSIMSQPGEFNYQNWSLAVPHLFPMLGDVGMVDAQSSFGVFDLQPTAIRLPSLRYGQVVVVSTTDVLVDGSLGAPGSFGGATTYLRNDVVSPPHIAFDWDGPASEQREFGDSPVTFVLRSYEPDALVLPLDRKRVVYAPRAAFAVVEQHGLLDFDFGSAPGVPPPNDDYWGRLDPKWDTVIESYQEPMPVQSSTKSPRYLPDPMATGITVHGITDKKTVVSDVALFNRTDGVQWPDWGQCEIHLTVSDDDLQIAADRVSTNILRIGIPKGSSYDLSYVTTLDKDSLDLFDVYAAAKQRIGRDVLSDSVAMHIAGRKCLAGSDPGIPLINPAGKIRVVHALQKPLFDPSVTGPFIPAGSDFAGSIDWSRPAGSSIGRLTIDGSFPNRTSAAFVVNATYTDWDTANGTKVVRRVNLITDTEYANGAKDGTSYSFIHDFGSTREFRLQAELTAKSSFANYFDPKYSSTRNSNQFDVVVRSTVRPPLPNVLYAEPGMYQDKANLTDGGWHWNMTGNRINLFLGDWYMSGIDELLAVVIDSANADASTNIYYDPVTVGAAALNPSHLTFPKANGLVQEGSQNWYLHPVRDPARPGDPWESIIDIRYDGEEIPAYMPFVRLVIARYQPGAIDSCKMSPFATIAWVPILSNRGVSINYQLNELRVMLSRPQTRTSNTVTVELQKRDPQFDWVWSDAPIQFTQDATDPTVFTAPILKADRTDMRILIKESRKTTDFQPDAIVWVREVPADLG